MGGPRIYDRDRHTNQTMKTKLLHFGLLLLAASSFLGMRAPAQAADKKPNILIIWGDDVGMYNISAYHRGLMRGSTPNIDHRQGRDAVH